LEQEHILGHGHLVRHGTEPDGAQGVGDGILGAELVHDRVQEHDEELEHDGEVEHDEEQAHGVAREHGVGLEHGMGQDGDLDKLLFPHRKLQLHSHHGGQRGS